MTHQNTPKAYVGHAPQLAAIVKPARKRRSFKAQIQSLLAEGKSAPEIVDQLGCYPSTVYHYQKRGVDRLQSKIDRFNQRRPGYELDKKSLAALTEWKCAVTSRPIDAEKDSFCIGVVDALPAVYLSSCKALAQAIEGLRAAGWTVTRE